MKYVLMIALMSCFAASVAAHESVETDLRAETVRMSEQLKEAHRKHVEAMAVGATEAYIEINCREKLSMEMRVELANPQACGDALRSLSADLNPADHAAQLEAVEQYKAQHGM